jgi:hypothetical protein
MGSKTNRVPVLISKQIGVQKKFVLLLLLLACFCCCCCCCWQRFASFESLLVHRRVQQLHSTLSATRRCHKATKQNVCGSSSRSYKPCQASFGTNAQGATTHTKTLQVRIICDCIIPLTQPTGVINHLKSALHSKVQKIITKEATRVVCTVVGDKFVVQGSQDQAAVSLSGSVQSLEEVRKTKIYSTLHTEHK